MIHDLDMHHIHYIALTMVQDQRHWRCNDYTKSYAMGKSIHSLLRGHFETQVSHSYKSTVSNRLLIYSRPNQVPTGEDIHRFMDSMVQITESHHESADTLSHSWFQHGLKFKIEACKFDHADFKLTTQDGMKLQALSASFLKAGVLTKDPYREKQWLGTAVVQRCVSALFKDALENGTLSWDVVICRAATVVLISALGRGGDVVTSTNYTKNQMQKHAELAKMAAPASLTRVSRLSLYDEMMCLRYEDITIKIEEPSSKDRDMSFVAEFVMRQDKGEKYVPSHYPP